MSTHIFSNVRVLRQDNFTEPSKTILNTLKELRVDKEVTIKNDTNKIIFDYEKIKYNSHC